MPSARIRVSASSQIGVRLASEDSACSTSSARSDTKASVLSTAIDPRRCSSRPRSSARTGFASALMTSNSTKSPVGLRAAPATTTRPTTPACDSSVSTSPGVRSDGLTTRMWITATGSRSDRCSVWRATRGADGYASARSGGERRCHTHVVERLDSQRIATGPAATMGTHPVGSRESRPSDAQLSAPGGVTRSKPGRARNRA